VQHSLAGEEACCLGVFFPYLAELQVDKVEDLGNAVLPGQQLSLRRRARIWLRPRIAGHAIRRPGSRWRASSQRSLANLLSC
jgi:hypothetical protein